MTEKMKQLLIVMSTVARLNSVHYFFNKENQIDEIISLADATYYLLREATLIYRQGTA